MEHEYLQKFVVNFFKELNVKDIPYCILRNYEKLPHYVGNDIDILIDESKHENIKSYLEKIIQKLGWKSFYKCEKDSFFTLICYCNYDNKIITLQIDIWTDLKWRGISWINKETILKNRRVVNTYYVPAKGAEAAITSIKELMGKGTVPKKYYEKIECYSKADKDNFINTLSPIFNSVADEIYQNCSQGKFENMNKMGKLLMRKLIKSNTYLYFKESFKNLINKINEFFKPNGKLVAFVGPDGSGKTTIIEQEKEYFKNMYKNIETYHMRYGIFPELKTGYGFSSMKGKVSSEATTSNKSAKKIRRSVLSILASWVIVLYYTLEFSIGGYKVLIAKRKNTLVIYDRYYYDFFIQPTTRDLIRPFRKLLQAVVIKPDLIIHLNADPNVVYKRKQELKVNEIKAQNEWLIKLFKTNKKAYSILTDVKNADEISSEVFELMVSKLISK